MNTDAPSVAAELEREDRLDIAHELYKALVAQYPDRLIILCDDRARVLAHREGYANIAKSPALRRGDGT
jgi:hypothetical protein